MKIHISALKMNKRLVNTFDWKHGLISWYLIMKNIVITLVKLAWKQILFLVGKW